MSPKKVTQESAKSTTAIGKTSKGFTDEERVAMKERAQELKAAASRGPRAGKADGEADVLAKIAEMPEPDRVMAERIHAIVKAAAPDLSPRTWYGMPAYAKDGSVKFTASGKPSLIVAKAIRDEVALMRENFIAHLEADTRAIRHNHPDEYAQQVSLAKKAGEPIIKADRDNLDAAVRAQVAAAMAEAEKKAAAVDAAPAGAEDGAPEREMVPVA